MVETNLIPFICKIREKMCMLRDRSTFSVFVVNKNLLQKSIEHIDQITSKLGSRVQVLTYMYY